MELFDLLTLILIALGTFVILITLISVIVKSFDKRDFRMWSIILLLSAILILDLIYFIIKFVGVKV